MKDTRFAGCAAGVALFYCSVVGVCQGIPAQPGDAPRLAHETPAPPEVARPAPRGRTSIKFLATDAKGDGLTPKSCQEVLAVLLPNIQAYPHPSDWTWFVACDEGAWARIQSHEGNQLGSGILAITNRPAHSSIIRGSAMLHAYSDDYRAQPEHVIAHELCHIYLQSSDESEVDALATQWVKERRAKQLALLRR